MKRPTDSPSRRFHWRARDRRVLRSWEVAAWSALFSAIPESRLWAAVLCDGLKCVYRARSPKLAGDALDWIIAPRGDSLGDFVNLCEAIGVASDDVRRDVIADVRAGRTASRIRGT